MKISVRTRRAVYTDSYLREFKRLRDPVGRAAVVARIERAKAGNFGDYATIGEGVYELRIDSGPGYRVYFGIKGGELIVLVILGTKGSQTRDTRKAIELWNRVRRENV
jgi:putative addiction module killer protein